MVRYKEASVELVSPEKKIDVCKVYSLSGKMVSVIEPAANRVEFQNQSFRPGVYIISATVNGKVFNHKVVFK